MTKISFTAFSFSFSLKKNYQKKSKKIICMYKKVYSVAACLLSLYCVYLVYFLLNLLTMLKREREKTMMREYIQHLYNNLPEYYLKME